MSTTLIQTRVSRDVKAEAEQVLNELGLSINDGIRLFLNQVRISRSVPFQPTAGHYPNAETRRAIDEANRGIGVERVSSIEELMGEIRGEQ